MHRILLTCIAGLLIPSCARTFTPPHDAGTKAQQRLPDRLVLLRTSLPKDSLVVPRGPSTVIVSAAEAQTHLEQKLAKYPYIRSDSALLRRIRDAVSAQGWATLVTGDPETLARENFLLVALIAAGQAAIRRTREGDLPDRATLVYWGTCAMANGRIVILPDSTEVLRTLDGWHGCFDA